MLDSAIKEQLRIIFSGLEAKHAFDTTVSPQHESRNELLDLLNDVASCSEKLSYRIHEDEGLGFTLLKDDQKTGTTFRAVSNGHKFSSLLLAVLDAGGKNKNFLDEGTCSRVEALKGPIRLTTCMSLTYTNCPDVVQALSATTTLNVQIQHQAVDGAINQAGVEALKIQEVPSVFADGKLIHIGRDDFGKLLSKLEGQYGVEQNARESSIRKYDVIVVGGGPASSAAVTYSAHKSLNMAVITERISGQVRGTINIENLISVPSTTGSQLADNLRTHMARYPIDLLEHRRLEELELEDKDKVLTARGGERFSAPAAIITTGASWRKLNVPDEAEYIGRGVVFCPCCDGPFYKGKHVVVVGEGSSGIEAATGLAGIYSKVTVLEFIDKLKADQVLQEELKSLPNVGVFIHSQIIEVIGSGGKITGIRVKDRRAEQEQMIGLDGISVRMGLMPDSSIFRETVEVDHPGEVIIDSHYRTNAPGIYAAGDVSTVPYKQIIIAMEEGTKAALTAFEDRMCGEI